jgi:hypothetical protein
VLHRPLETILVLGNWQTGNPVSDNAVSQELANNARARKLPVLFAEKQHDLRCCDHLSDSDARAGS